MKPILALIALVALIGCAPSNSSMQERIRKECGTQEVARIPLPDSFKKFVLRKEDGSVWYVDANTKEPLFLEPLLPPTK